MIRRLLFAALLAMVALLTGGGTTSFAYSASIAVNPPCGVIYFTPASSIRQAVAMATAGDVIFVCPGTYTEPSMNLTPSGVQIVGPGATSGEVSGVATVKRADPSIGSATFNLLGAGDQVRGLTIDETPVASDSQGTVGVWVQEDNQEVALNTFVHSTAAAVIANTAPIPANVSIHDNTVTAAVGSGIICICSGGDIKNNTVGPVGLDSFGISAEGGHDTYIESNIVNQANVTSTGNNIRIWANQIDGQGANLQLISVTGGSADIDANLLSNTDDAAIGADVFGAFNTTVTISRNQFNSVRDGISLADFGPGTVLATIGGSPGKTNLFNTPANDFNVVLAGVSNDINAEYNNWGYCDAGQIEGSIYHHVDDPGLGTVDFSHYYDAIVCPTATPTPTPSATATPTPTATPGATQRKFGDLNCDGAVTNADALGPVDFIAGLQFPHAVSCPAMGDAVLVTVGNETADTDWGNVDCLSGVIVLDALAILEKTSGLPYDHRPECALIGQAVTVELEQPPG